MQTVRKISLSSVGNHFSLRCDAKYRLFWGINGALLYPHSKVECHAVKHALVPFEPRTAKKGELDENLELIELEDVEKRTGVVVSSSTVRELQSAKLIFGSADVLTTRLRPNLGKTICNDRSRNLAGTTEWIPLKLNHAQLHPLLLKYYLLSSRYVDNAERLLSGKEHPRVAESDIFALRIPFPPPDVQTVLAGKISSIETDMETARVGIRAPEDIINEIICAEFHYPLKEHQERAREHHFVRTLGTMAAGFTLRNSAKFHHPGFELTERFFARTPHERLKAFVAVPIRLGATATKGDLIEEGDAYYVHPGATKKQRTIALEDCHHVTQGFYDANQRRFSLRRGDIVLNRSGEGTIGKCGIWESDEPALASDFTMRVRFSDRMNPRFAWYFFRSVMFQAQIEREKRGMGNMTNIFPPQVERMHIVTCKRDRQDALAQQIAVELQVLDDRRTSIENKRKEINRLIDEAISKAR